MDISRLENAITKLSAALPKIAGELCETDKLLAETAGDVNPYARYKAFHDRATESRVAVENLVKQIEAFCSFAASRKAAPVTLSGRAGGSGIFSKNLGA